MDNNRINLELGLDFSAITEALIQVKSQFTGTEKDFQRISSNISKAFSQAQAAASLYGKDSSQVVSANKRLERSFVELGANGINYASSSFETLQREANKIGGTLDNSNSKLKKNGQQWTNLALVVQDLPYGFRGIQNNLPALMGGMAGVASAGYLAFSILIAIVTVYEKEIVQLVYGITGLDTATKKMNDTLASSEGTAKAQIASDKALLIIINDVTKSTDERKRALDELKDRYKGNIELQKTDITDGTELIGIYNKISDALLRKARAAAYATLIAEEEAKIAKLQRASARQLVRDLDNVKTSLAILGAGATGTTASMNLVLAAVGGNAEKIKDAEDNLAVYTKGLNDNTVAQIANNDEASIGAKDKDDAAQIAKKKADALSKAQDVQMQNYIDTLSERNKEIVKSELQLQDDIAILYAAGFTNYESALTANRARIDKINQTYDDEEFKRKEKNRNEIIAFETKLRDDLRKIDEDNNKAFIKESERIANQQARNVEVQLGIEEKLNKGSLEKRIKYTKEAMAKLAAMAMMSLDPASMGVYLAMFDKMDAKLKGYGSTWGETVKIMDKAIFDFISNSLVSLGENIGKAFAGENIAAFDGLAMLLADSLSQIGKALIAFALTQKLALMALSNPLSWPIALAAGFAAVTAGSYLKSKLSSDKTKKFANGGIISGPTMGLMGEYPGAQHNPEVVAPLDKLKDMIGGGGGNGTFVLRGQDLLLSVNRAQKASSLKGQNISLA